MNLVFILFCLFIFVSSFLVILSVHAIYSVLSLILVYIFVAIIFMFLGAEFLSLLLFIIYVGAISIMFLFIVMLLDLRVLEMHNAFYSYLPISGFIGSFFFICFMYFFFFDFNNSIANFINFFFHLIILTFG